MYKYKLRMKGNLKLVGELLMRGIMTPKVGLHIMNELLESRDKDKLEALASFMTTVGEFFEVILLRRHSHFSHADEFPRDH